MICISTLAAALLYNDDVKGLSFNESEYLLTQFADDATLVLDGSERSLRGVFNLLHKYESCSGLKINMEKTKAVWIGKDVGKQVQLCPEIGIIWIKNSKFKILGIEYDLLQEDITELNFNNKLESIKKLLSTWGWRYLTLFGKLTIIKNLAIPLLVHLFRALPNPLTKFNSVCYEFIWNKKPDKIHRSILISDYENGGLKMLHFESFSKSMKIYWVRKLLNSTTITEWKTLILDKLIKYSGNFV